MEETLTEAQKRIKSRNEKIVSKYLELKSLGALNEKAISEAAKLNKVTTRTAFSAIKESGKYQYSSRKNK